ncbi:hypothetical protein GCM10010238_13110 [Streptomyces griseoviridis]|uniref:Uncharacterized protein n=1 Tax=Streptomyces griseoviridis TaxID=45398 RepID=A0A918GA56_STRGD|nr:hypothetical protein GCM10010238_13110 [Streptomyces niveoruber]
MVVKGESLRRTPAGRTVSVEPRDTLGVRAVRALSARGVLVGTVHCAQLPALYAATSPDAEPGGFYGPAGPGHLGGAPGPQKLYGPLRDPEEAGRVWRVSEELTGVRIAGWGPVSRPCGGRASPRCGGTAPRRRPCRSPRST